VYHTNEILEFDIGSGKIMVCRNSIDAIKIRDWSIDSYPLESKKKYKY
jgi:hypothetical protein